jgi:hypothetical protein
MNADDKIRDFFYKSIKLYGKEISIPSNQHFSIDQIIDDEEFDPDKPVYKFKIQYGFPQSGCIGLKFTYADDKYVINDIDIFAPPADKEMIVANYSPQVNAGPISIGINFGIDMGTVKHSSEDEIKNNPNALKMLDIAISDLEKAEIHGKCTAVVPEGSSIIPCTNSIHTSEIKGKGIQ